MMLLDLPVRCFSCVYWTPVKAAASSRPPDSLPPSADTNWCSKPHARIMESLRDPTLVRVQVDRKGAAMRRTPSALCYTSKTEITFSLAALSVGKSRVEAGLTVVGEDRIGFSWSL